MKKESYDLLFKLILIGDSCVGKSNILSKYLKNEFDPNSRATVGVEFGTKNILINNKKIKIQIWDTAGQERYRSITSAYYKGAKGALIVYDITRKATFNNIDKWISDLKLNGDKDICIVILGNKSDLNDKRQVTFEEGQKMAKDCNMMFFETSAKTGENVEKIFVDSAKEIQKKINQGYYDLENDVSGIKRGFNSTGSGNPVIINNNPNGQSGRKSCCF